MKTWRQMVKKFLSHEEGATAVEYALMASLIAAAIAVTVLTLGQAVAGLFSDMSDKFP